MCLCHKGPIYFNFISKLNSRINPLKCSNLFSRVSTNKKPQIKKNCTNKKQRKTFNIKTSTRTYKGSPINPNYVQV